MKKNNGVVGNSIKQRKIKVAALITLVIFIVGEIMLLGVYSTKQTNFISFFVIQDTQFPGGINSFLIFVSITLAILCSLNLLFLHHLRKIYISAAQNNKEFLLEINKQKNDEMKEIAMTRNIILMKLMGKNRSN